MFRRFMTDSELETLISLLYEGTKGNDELQINLKELDRVFKKIRKLNTDEAVLERHGWEIVCQSPFEIRHKEDGSFATGSAAHTVLAVLREGE